MQTNFDIRRSKKSHIDSELHFIVTNDDIVFLRILGNDFRYEIMTATADEDNGAFRSDNDQKRLIEAALITSSNLFYKINENIGSYYSSHIDYHGREYIKICECEFISDAYRVAEEFFKIINESAAPKALTPATPTDRGRSTPGLPSELLRARQSAVEANQPSSKTIRTTQPITKAIWGWTIGHIFRET